jgi:hypothetical protein
MDDRPIDEVYDTIRDVEQDPIGALMAIQQLVAEVARLREALELIVSRHDGVRQSGKIAIAALEYKD